MQFEDIRDLLVAAFPPERMGTLLTAIAGTLAGGFTTYFVQTRLRRREQIATLKERLKMFAMVTSRIIADMQNIQNLIELYRRENSPKHELWQVVHTIDFVPSLKPELTQLDALISLGSGRLVTRAMHLFSEYVALVAVVDRYNGLRKDFLEARRKPDRKEDEVENLRLNMINHLNFINETSLAVIEEAKEAQHLLYVKSQRYFGNAEFLRLSDD